MDKIRNIISSACRKHSDSKEASFNKEARVIMQALEEAGYTIVPIVRTGTDVRFPETVEEVKEYERTGELPKDNQEQSANSHIGFEERFGNSKIFKLRDEITGLVDVEKLAEDILKFSFAGESNEYKKHLVIMIRKAISSSAGYSPNDLHTAINMARGITFNGDKHNFHHTNTEIVEYVNSLRIKNTQPTGEGSVESNEDALWIEANRLYSLKDHSADGRKLQMEKFKIISK